MRIAFFVAAIFVAGTSPAFAYLDPGTGSMLLQALIGGIVAAFAVWSFYWNKLKALVSQFWTKKKPK